MYQYEYKTIHELRERAAAMTLSLSDVVIRHEMETSERTEQVVRDQMESRLAVFQESIDAGLKDTEKSVSGLVGGDADKLLHGQPKLLGPLARKAAVYALAVSEANAKMFKIVACPTAGSCGIVPAVMTAAAEELGTPRETCVNALFTASGIGAVVARNASVAGAVGGCQAECGTAAAMGAAAVAQMAGGTNDEILNAFALCMKNTLGLACDPVAGLVEVPCVKRNACYAVLAITAAEMALAGIQSVIPPDEVIEAMNEIGRLMPVSLKETSDAGLAKTPTGKAIAARLEAAMDAE
ncbi:L-serine ammonia-lyase, iron-sulfur-dependent, subunit alpha [uncultured Megasphaera sp.]|uniref:L-serine ammonia-lyase, iron-sulfur-dependent, subunit alpha n=1 Tax=uncultured Megasphaera sp. TaxID=165188 RepID=UPI002657AEFC|nr:L-serine ammonia-lyase, iron-sulfur-dependent, subunit alpha [uncultured Megasphaera sp.]